jgi:hypothetical protein
MVVTVLVVAALAAVVVGNVRRRSRFRYDMERRQRDD